MSKILPEEMLRKQEVKGSNRAERRREEKFRKKGLPWHDANTEARRNDVLRVGGGSVPPRKVRRNKKALAKWFGG